MSKKLAGGSDCILLDVKTGSGAFMKTLEESVQLAQAMVSIGARAGRKTAALITDMDHPLGRAVGNALEVEEACQVLRGEGPGDLRALSVELAAWMAWMAGKAPSLEEARALAEEKLRDGSALERFCRMVQAPGGRPLGGGASGAAAQSGSVPGGFGPKGRLALPGGHPGSGPGLGGFGGRPGNPGKPPGLRGGHPVRQSAGRPGAPGGTPWAGCTLPQRAGPRKGRGCWPAPWKSGSAPQRSVRFFMQR